MLQGSDRSNDQPLTTAAAIATLPLLQKLLKVKAKMCEDESVISAVHKKVHRYFTTFKLSRQRL